MITAKIFKVKEIITNGNKKYYKVFGYDNKFHYFFNAYSFCGEKDNETFMDALDQIDTLNKWRVVSSTTIHVVFPKKPKSEKQPVKTL